MAGYISRMSHSRPICTCAIISASILVDPTCVDHLALWKSTPQRKQRITDNRREKKTLGIQESCHGDREVAPVCAPITRFHVWMGLRYASRHRPPAHPRTVTLALSDPAPPRTVHASALRLRRITRDSLARRNSASCKPKPNAIPHSLTSRYPFHPCHPYTSHLSLLLSHLVGIGIVSHPGPINHPLHSASSFDSHPAVRTTCHPPLCDASSHRITSYQHKVIPALQHN